MRKSFAFRLYPTTAQARRMKQQLWACQRLYNAMLEQRRMAYRMGCPISRFKQEAEIKDVRTIPEYEQVYAHILQDVARRVDLAFQAFFRRVKAGQKPGYPRFKSRQRYDSLTYKEPGNGCVKVVGNRVSFSKLASGVRVFQHRPIRGVIKTVTVKRKAGKWFVVFSCADVPPDPALKAGVGAVGVDMGVYAFATLDTGEKFVNNRYAKQAEAKLRSAQRRVSRAKRGSMNRRKLRRILARHHEHVRNQRRDHAAKWARQLVQRFGFIAVEDLDIKGMLFREPKGERKKRRGLRRSLNDVAMGQALAWLAHKAEEAGARLVKVPPEGTTRTCSTCGRVKAVMPLSERTYACAVCGLTLDRDVNAARNILQRARTEPPWRAYDGRSVEAGSPWL